MKKKNCYSWTEFCYIESEEMEWSVYTCLYDKLNLFDVTLKNIKFEYTINNDV